MPRCARRPLVAFVVVALLTAGLLGAAPAVAAAQSSLTVGETLEAGAQLRSPGDTYRLTLRDDGDLVLTGPGRTLWQTGTRGTDAHLVLQTDGNLVLYAADGHALWNTHTSDAFELRVQDDGNLVLYGGTPTALRARWTPHTPGPTLASGEYLTPGESVISADGRYHLSLTTTGVVLTGPGRTLWSLEHRTTARTQLVMREDGAFYLAEGDDVVWSAGTSGHPGAVATVANGRVDVTSGGTSVWHSPSPPSRLTPGVWLVPGERIVSASGLYSLVVQGDGNLVLYGPGGASWTTRTSGAMKGLVLQGDGNLVLYRTSGAAAWSTRTHGGGGFLQMQNDAHLVLYDGDGRATWSVWARSAALNAAVAAAEAFGAAQGERTAVAVLDRATGLLYAAGDVNASFASASVVKVFIAARLLSVGAQSDPATANLMYRMITLSDDAAATQLWPRAGGAGVTDWVTARYGITGLGHPTQAGWWGLTQITAQAMVRFYAAVKVDPAVGPWLTDAMAHAAQISADGWNQWFGIPSATTGWKVKQGWMCCLENRTRMHTTGFLQGDRYTAAILTDGTTAYYGQRGSDVVTGAAVRMLPGRRVPA